MAVVDKYVNSDLQSGRMGDNFKVSGSSAIELIVAFETEACDANSVFRVAKALPSNYKIKQILVANDAIAGGTDIDIGIYKVDDSVKDADALADGLNLSSAHAVGSDLQGTSALDLADYDKPIYELAGDSLSDKDLAYDLALTTNAAITAAGTILVRISLVS